MPTAELSAGPIAYTDTGGDGPPLVFVHGVMMNGTGWRLVVDRLAEGYRCIVPDWPLGGHSLPMRAGADLSLRMPNMTGSELLEQSREAAPGAKLLLLTAYADTDVAPSRPSTRSVSTTTC